MPKNWRIRNYRIYSPQWLPNGKSDILRSFRAVVKDERTEEILVVVPGWNRAPKLSALILQSVMWPSLRRNGAHSAVLFTFPFYSHVAQWVKASFPHTPVAYHAHDPFEFYAYPEGYIRSHESRMIPLCDRVFVIADKLGEDFLTRHPGSKPETLGNAVDAKFMESRITSAVPLEIVKIRNQGCPVIGCVGQINQSYDWDLLESVASSNPKSQLLFIGNLFEEGAITDRIRTFFTRVNVHWIGPRPHHELKHYMEHCDTLLNPLAVNAQNDRRDTLRMYDYLSTNVPVVSTPIASVARHAPLIVVPASRTELLEFLGRRPDPLPEREIDQRGVYLAANTWSARGLQLASAFSARQ